MWLGYSQGRAWSCDQCKAKTGLRALRGSCGGPFLNGLPQAQSDEAGLFVPGYRIAPDSGESFSEVKVRSCPVALANRAAPIVQAYRRHRAGLFDLSQTYPQPSCAIVEAIDILHSSTEEAEHRLRERTMREASHGHQ